MTIAKIVILCFCSIISLLIVIIYLIERKESNKRSEELLISYIVNECKLNPNILENNLIDDIKFIAKKLGIEEKKYIYKKLDSKNSDKYVEYLLIKVKKVFEGKK